MRHVKQPRDQWNLSANFKMFFISFSAVTKGFKRASTQAATDLLCFLVCMSPYEASVRVFSIQGSWCWHTEKGFRVFFIFHFKVLTSGSLTFFMHTLQEEGVMSVLGKISRLKLQLKKYIKGALRNFSVVLESQSFPKPTNVSYRRSQLVEWVESLRHRSVCIQSHPFHCHWKTNPKLSTVQECWTT